MLKLIPCRAVPAGTARAAQVELPDRRLEVIVVNDAGRYHAYLNSCPHTGGPLNWRPEIFFDASGQYLQCATHGARFRPATGYCIDGPCSGAWLARVAIEIVDGTVCTAQAGTIPVSAKRS